MESQFRALLEATVLAASEVMPAEGRDLSELLESRDGPAGLITSQQTPRASREDHLLFWLQRNIDEGRVSFWVEQLKRLAATQTDARMVLVTDPDYPECLRRSYDRPPFLFERGEILSGDRRAVAIVGSRMASKAAIKATIAVAEEAVRARVTVVSGLASGVDSHAHRTAIECDGRTIAVIGAGIDADPRLDGDHPLADAIVRAGALVSQFRPGSPPTRSTFPARNAVISGLSVASLIMEASERSGTRSELDASIRQGRPVYFWLPAFHKARWAELIVDSGSARFFESFEDVKNDFMNADLPC
ncbi:DNA-processing protein DprA [Kribbella yunnanensis]|uniref:DNA-processing protein DprA n=1 Tax=Kribbella yunnanensis TaxID=190194 RepID=UPI0031E44A4B